MAIYNTVHVCNRKKNQLVLMGFTVSMQITIVEAQLYHPVTAALCFIAVMSVISARSLKFNISIEDTIFFFNHAYWIYQTQHLTEDPVSTRQGPQFTSPHLNSVCALFPQLDQNSSHDSSAECQRAGETMFFSS